MRRALPAGDYSIEGMETRVSVERKSLDDLVSTVILARGRFHAELRRLQRYDAACVVVEAGLDEVLKGRYRSAADPKAILGSILSIIVDFSIPFYFCGNRQAARLFVEQYLLRAHRKLSRPCT